MLPAPTTVSLLGVISGLSPVVCLSLIGLDNWALAVSASVVIICLVCALVSLSHALQSANYLCALFLGLVSSLALISLFHRTRHSIFAVYVLQLAFFHWSEFFITSLTNPAASKIDFYMLNHSPEYKVALVLSVVEYWAEKSLFPAAFDRLGALSLVGLAVSVSGEALRKAALWTAGSNFNHYVESVKRPEHTLVRAGVYRWFRHPSYVGWFYFSIGTQLALLNPICFVGYSIASWKFFAARIYDEEKKLIRFFGTEYVDYQREVGTGLPFIAGCVKSPSIRSS